LLCAAFLLTVIPVREPKAQAQQPSSGEPKIEVTSALVFLDVTVLDKKGHPVVSGLTQDDFTIKEDKKPQRIFSFEAPETHFHTLRSAAVSDGAADAVGLADRIDGNW
jgi:hypothetical protein